MKIVGKPNENDSDIFNNNKRLLRVRTSDFYSKMFDEAELELVELNKEVYEFHAFTQKLGLVTKIILRQSRVHALNYTIPILRWYKMLPVPAKKDSKGRGLRKRTEIRFWKQLEILLVATNATYDEKILHLLVHMRMDELRSKARLVCDKLREANILKTDYKNNIETAKINSRMWANILEEYYE